MDFAVFFHLMPRINKLYLFLLSNECRIIYKGPSTSYLVAYTLIWFWNDIWTNIESCYLCQYFIFLFLNPCTEDKIQSRIRKSLPVSVSCNRKDANTVKLHGRYFILAHPRNIRQHRPQTTSRNIHKTVCMHASTRMDNMYGQGCQISTLTTKA